MLHNGGEDNTSEKTEIKYHHTEHESMRQLQIQDRK